jgi:hypothetical protein
MEAKHDPGPEAIPLQGEPHGRPGENDAKGQT